jgi:nickel-dependent lactate racemase
MGSRACREGGSIVLLAECADGLGKSDFLKWFEAETARQLAETLSHNYQVSGQTAWSLLTIAERFDVQIVTALDGAQTGRMRLHKTESFEAIWARINAAAENGYILPYGGKFLIESDGDLS